MLGLIGGTGLGDALFGEAFGREHVVETPFGAPSSRVRVLEWSGLEIAVLSRHGEGHLLAPSQVPYRANVFALKALGVTHLIVSGAVGSLREEYRPKDLVLVDQVIDKTLRREPSFFDQGMAVHAELAQPYCGVLRERLARVARDDATVGSLGGARVHGSGTYVCMEGPQFSTVAEANMHRAWGGDLIGMTAMPEAKLAREAELPFSTLALATDYDCWHDDHDHVTVEAVVATMKANVASAQKAIAALAARLPDPTKSVAHGAARGAVMTAPDAMPADAKARLGWLLG